MKSIYDKNGYSAVVCRGGTVVVTRTTAGGDSQTPLTGHIGEKHTSQDWREVVLCGCPLEIKREIAKAHLQYLAEQV